MTDTFYGFNTNAPKPVPLSAEELRDLRAFYPAGSPTNELPPVVRMLATIDAQARDYLGAQAAWEAERDKLEGRVGALTEALRDIANVPGIDARRRARTALVLTVEPEADEEGGCPICDGGSGTPCNSHFGV